jgi:hypothetical protein
MTFDQIAAHGQDRWLEELRQELRATGPTTTRKGFH